MRTTVKEIKDRVEIKIAETIDQEAFAVLYNSSISELNEISFIEAPKYKVRSKDIIRVNPRFEISIGDIKTLGGNIDTEDFEYYFGTNELNWYWKDGNVNDINDIITVKEVGLHGHESSKLSVKLNTHGFVGINDSDVIVFEREMFDYSYTNSFANASMVAFKLPSNFSTMVRVEAVNNSSNSFSQNKTAVKEVSINSFDEGNIAMNTIYDYVYYIHNGYVFVIGINPESFNIVYTRNMNKISPTTDPAVLYVEIDESYENLLVLSIAHKFLENFVGSEDSETQAVFTKYQILKKEYETTNVPKRKKRRQSTIDTNY